MQPPTAYDELPYESRPVPGTSPARLARTSELHGGPRPPDRGFRAVELGCGDGANLLPLAFYHPTSSFVGIDSAATAVAAARAAVDELALGNVRFEYGDLADPGATPAGEFDYVIVHGVFSWVDARTQGGILRIVRACLAPRGVLYLSHNVRAGWVVRGLVRDLLRSATADQDGAHERVRRARQVVGELCPVVAASDHTYHELLASELERVAGSSDGYLYHEYLSPENVAFDHAQVVALLAEHGLAYLCDAWHDRAEGRVPAPLREVLERLGHAGNALEQAADVLGYRRFRASVFCRDQARDPDGRVLREQAEAPPQGVTAVRGRPHRLAAFEARRRASLTMPDHMVLALREEEREIVRRLAEGQEVDAVEGFVERLGRAGLLEP